MRFVRTLISLGFVIFGVLVLIVAAGAYLTATGRSVPAIRSAAAQMGRLTEGQTTEQVSLSVTVDPSARRLDGLARLRVKATGGRPRQRLYWMLDDGFEVRDVWQEGAGGTRRSLGFHRVWLAVVVELDEALIVGDEVTIGVSYGGDPLSGVSPFGQAVFTSDEIVLTPTDLWYPSDLGSFMRADVEVTLPVHLDLVHPGTAEVVTNLGNSERRRWTTGRLTPGLSLVAGRFATAAIESGGVVHRAYVGDGIDLSAERVATAMATAFDGMAADYGASGASRQTAFVSRRLRRPFADGSGLFGLQPGQFRGGDYGFAAVAEGVARTWWGGVVAAQLTAPQSGGAWVIEGLAANAARAAVRRQFGDDAAFRWKRDRMFDPSVAGVLRDVSLIDGELDASSCETLAGKSAWVASMLEERVGGDAYRGAARQLLDSRRHQMVAAGDLEEAFSSANLGEFFTQWVDGIGRVDLSLDPRQGGAVLANHHAVEIDSEVVLWRVPPGGQPVEQTIGLGGSTPLGNVERLVADPRGAYADMLRANNVLPREAGPRAIARSQRGSWFVVEGEPNPWAPVKIREIDATGQTRQLWDFDQGLIGAPRWSADGTRVMAVEPPRGGDASTYELHSSDGSQRRVGRDTIVAAGAEGYAAARGGRLVWVGKEAGVLASVDGRVAAPLVRPDDAAVAYVAVLGAQMELRVVDRTSRAERVLMTWPTAPVDWRWSPDGGRLYAVLGGDWDWQLWEIPLANGPRPLVREAAKVRALAVSPNGDRIALAAQGVLDDSFERYEVFVVDRNQPSAGERYTVGGRSALDLAWRDDNSLFVVVSDSTYSMVPSGREIKVLELADGSVVDFQ